VAEIQAILPTPSADSREFWGACNNGELLLQECSDCRHVFYYPRQMCPRCGGRHLRWRASTGKGSVYSFTQVQVSFYGPTWERDLPYTVVLVDLEEGPRMLSRLVESDQDAVAVGAALEVAFVTVEGQALPMFRLC
jgi:uncharacterized OB-fold protein